MKAIATTHMSSKGHILIPENIRKQLILKEGTQFVVGGTSTVYLLRGVTSWSFSVNVCQGGSFGVC